MQKNFNYLKKIVDNCNLLLYNAINLILNLGDDLYEIFF